jgi:hypothetical protein
VSRIYVGGVSRALQKAYWRAFRRGAVIDSTAVSATPQGDVIFSQVTDGGRPEHVIIKAAQVGLMVEVLQKAIDDAFEHGRLATWELENVSGS